MDGYEAISVPINAIKNFVTGKFIDFGGLESKSNGDSLLAGSVYDDFWFYAVAASHPYLWGIPGAHADYGEAQVELWAVCPISFVPMVAPAEPPAEPLGLKSLFVSLVDSPGSAVAEWQWQ